MNRLVHALFSAAKARMWASWTVTKPANTPPPEGDCGDATMDIIDFVLRTVAGAEVGLGSLVLLLLLIVVISEPFLKSTLKKKIADYVLSPWADRSVEAWPGTFKGVISALYGETALSTRFITTSNIHISNFCCPSRPRMVRVKRRNEDRVSEPSFAGCFSNQNDVCCAVPRDHKNFRRWPSTELHCRFSIFG